MIDQYKLLAEPKSWCLQAPAGCGKTEEIVKAVKLCQGRQLILTHTHAGIASLKARLKKHQVPASQYKIDTIASWLLRYALAYPKISGLNVKQPEADQWNMVYAAAHELLTRRFIHDVIQASYTGIFVDEYQDCTRSQHAIIMQMAELLPVRMLGDPLQGIFGFRKDDPLVDWNRDVQANFSQLPDLTYPWRWRGKNDQLGDELMVLRYKLEQGAKINLLEFSEIKWAEWSIENELQACYEILDANGSVAVIHKWPSDAHNTARRMHGWFPSMEEMDCKDLMLTARELDKFTGPERVIKVILFAKKCMVVGTQLDVWLHLLSKKNIQEIYQRASGNEIAQIIIDIMENSSFEPVVRFLDMVRELPKVYTHRKELLSEMKRAIRVYIESHETSLHDAAWKARYRTRVMGRKPEKRIVSRTLLIKGLEFDHAIVLNADKLSDAKNFYVALTRGCQSLKVLSRSPEFQFGRVI